MSSEAFSEEQKQYLQGFITGSALKHSAGGGFVPRHSRPRWVWLPKKFPWDRSGSIMRHKIDSFRPERSSSTKSRPSGRLIRWISGTKSALTRRRANIPRAWMSSFSNSMACFTSPRRRIRSCAACVSRRRCLIAQAARCRCARRAIRRRLCRHYHAGQPANSRSGREKHRSPFRRPLRHRHHQSWRGR